MYLTALHIYNEGREASAGEEYFVSNVPEICHERSWPLDKKISTTL